MRMLNNCDDKIVGSDVSCALNRSKSLLITGIRVVPRKYAPSLLGMGLF